MFVLIICKPVLCSWVKPEAGLLNKNSQTATFGSVKSMTNLAVNLGTALLNSYLGVQWSHGIQNNDTPNNNTRPNDTWPNDTQPNDILPNDTRPNDTLPNDTQPNDTRPNDTRTNDTQPNDTQLNITQPNVTHPRDTQHIGLNCDPRHNVRLDECPLHHKRHSA